MKSYVLLSGQLWRKFLNAFSPQLPIYKVPVEEARQRAVFPGIFPLVLMLRHYSRTSKLSDKNA